MPKDTFLNLPNNKKERILDASIEEFARYSYHKASITRIVSKAKIAKGSFYQYFEDKKDLYKYILDKSGEEKMKVLNEALIKLDQSDFFEAIRKLYVAGIKFAKDNPKLASIGNDFMKNSDNKLRTEILGDNIPKSNELFEKLLIRGIEGGRIDPKIDVKLTAHLFTTLTISIGEYFLNEVKIEDDMEIMKLIDDMLYIFENGIMNNKEGI